AALFAAGVGQGDEVIMPALTVIMDAYAAIHLGAIPVFADVHEDTHVISVDDIARKITPRTKAIVTVSWEGLSCDMDPIMALARSRGIKVIDDSARTVLGRYKGRLAGTIADLSVFSFEAKKHMTCGGEGGMIVSNDAELARLARKFAGIGYRHLTADAGRTHLAIDVVQDPAYRRFDVIGLNYRLNDVSAAVGIGQLERIDELVRQRQAVGRMFEDATSGCGWLIPQRAPEGYEHAYYTFSAEYRGESVHGTSWKAFYNQYKAMGGDGFYGAVAIPYLEPALLGKTYGATAFAPGLCPVAEGLQQRVMCFKTNYRDLEVAKRKVDLLAELIRKF
ncbi:MAG: DegT/DnrJ/EryC1/StrS family aminotransferase, partial [Betaproteobacteria bacterium]|nr:DegT/DnrJ/EryC1/StrS family aminotransferase [Betaproteobacteria bacterium]